MTYNKFMTILKLIGVLVCIVRADNGMQGLGVTPIPQMPPVPRDPNSRCEEIKIPMCRGIGYNLTSFPNEMNHDTQEEAGLEANQFFPLVEMKCSPDLRFFLCSLYMPICIEDYHKPLPVCRSVCERTRAGCAPIMQKYSFPWPERMACDRFPEYQDQEVLCMQPDNYANEKDTSRSGDIDRTSSGNGRKTSTSNKCKGKNCKSSGTTSSSDRNTGVTAKTCDCTCKPPLVPITKDSALYNTSTTRIGTVENCAVPCRGAFFTREEKDFAGLWITLWSSMCFISTLMTLTTFIIDTERFKYPERPIVFLSLCYFVVAIGYLYRVFLGHDEVACDGRIIKYSSTGPTSCTMIFLVTYFFGMASSIWWVILSFTWFLAAGLKWGNESIAKHSQYFHLAAWLIPTVQTVAVVLVQAVDADPVAGICYVGNLNMENLKTFVLIPLVIYLVIGTSFLGAGFVSLFHIRSVIKQQGGIGAGAKADKLEKLMIRIGIFSVLYTVPASIVIGCSLYEVYFYDDWMASLTCPCRASAGVRRKPLYSLLMLKYFMALAVGITSGVWIWSGKTLDSWKRLWRRIFGSPDRSGANQALIKQRAAVPYPYAGSGIGVPSGAASLLATPYTQVVGSVASTSHHHLHHHVLKQPPASHV
ncbi:frizzled-2 isoform X1 [Sitodiplosis mosellana]|uniref:frizzled-2 isoform X1 n=1 Tax=Sitodiplosis mosellana TaxID=263140 RepID=UPI002444DA00|nr:frizzled-2 isoform X1 [Sitodiplosis mosellana]XP_055318994.1 frizzled-2 isoform X1 [Sitodiplosis mosellana]XP_055318995.1 frizzled-2 isoform X1 [Sitodiplosis mosellana]XP_055318996.1 frizzled-2 isoform X1 [Sitodiplosis mosellana]